MSNQIPGRLVRAVKFALDAARWLVIASLVALPLFAAAVSIGHAEKAVGTWGVDIGVYSSLAIDLDALSPGVDNGEGVRDPKIRGKAELTIDTSSLSAFLIFAAMNEFGGFVGLYILLQLRAIFASLTNGNVFVGENSARLVRVGFVTIGWAGISPLLQYFGGKAILDAYGLSIPGMAIGPAFEINGLALFIGAALIILSGVLQEANRMHESDRLTI